MSHRPPSTPDRWSLLATSTGVFGLAGMVLLFIPVIAMSGLGEPPFDGNRDEVARFFIKSDAGWVQAAEATTAVGMLALLWFFVGVSALLRRAEGEPAWRSTAALLSGALLVAYGTVDVSWAAAANRGSGTDPSVALFAFDVGNLGFANAWLAMASFALATGWVLLESRVLPRWCGWWAVAAGIGLVVGRYVWQSWFWMLPYALFWAGVVALAVRLLMRRQLGPPAAEEAGPVTDRTQA